MRFTLLDRITEIQPGVRITATKNLTLAEEYLADHFPGFPVMPGVLMLEALTQAGAWLVRSSEDFAHSIVVLKEARNIRYSSFVEPGQSLVLTAEIIDQDDRHTRLKGQGTINGQVAVSGRLVLERYNLADESADRALNDTVVIHQLRTLFSDLYRPAVAEPMAGSA
ncbi:MAG: beta-hydroxyacyl-ACP dehydratase [Planctomycetaceae bacterium]|nr:beta-hydroxyacyl-ACP dehydratase [Planctomycetaceae bacterium]